jgi:hypothetical protein
MRRITTYGGIAASIVLIAFGIGALVMGLNGRDTVRDSVKKEQIVGTPDMTPSAIRAEIAKAHLSNVDVPSKSVAGAKIDTPSEARTFAEYMRIHTLLATGGQVYAEMPRFLDKAGKPTEDQAKAAIDPKTGKPVENGARNIWVTETALSTALNTSFFADQVALFSIVMGFALLLTGIGFGVVTVRVLLGRREDEQAEPPRARTAAVTA